MRIVSVLPSATEMVWALGHGAELVGRSAECDYPATVRDVPIVMRPRSTDFDRPSGEIDARVSASRGRGESLYTIDIDRLRALRPDLILTQDLCGVCSVTGPELEAACEQAGVRPRLVSLTPRSLAEVWDSIETVAAALEDPDAGERLADELRRRTRAAPNDAGATVGVIEWLDPPIHAGLWSPEMVRAAGGRPFVARPGEPGVRTSWPELAAHPPDLLLLSPCSFTVDRTLREMDAPDLRAAVASVAAPYGTFVVDEAYFSRPGPRLADGVELVRHLLRGEAWEAPMPVRAWGAAGATA